MKIIKIISPIHFNVSGDYSSRYKRESVYLVDIEKERCTCNDWRIQTARLLPSEQNHKPTYACKHINFVFKELRPKYDSII